MEEPARNKIQYQPLDATKNELRLLYFVPRTEEQQQENMIRMELKTVSLDDFTTQSLEYMESGGLEFYSGTDYSSQLYHDASTIKRPFKSHEEKRMLFEHVKQRYLELRKGFGRWNWGDFVTLSYCWGGDESFKEIELNGCVTEVRENLWHYLREATKDEDLSHEGMRLGIWIDALCINQDDLSERSEQLKRMKSIYLQACCCCAWLGNASEGSEQVLNTLRTISLYNLTSAEERFNFMMANRGNENLYPSGFWRDLIDLLSRPYWKRLWVIQELTLSQHKVTFQCGSHNILWPHFFDAVNTIYIYSEWLTDHLRNNNREPGLEHESVIALYLALHRVFQLFHLSLRDPDSAVPGLAHKRINFKIPPLRRLLWIVIESNQSDERDKVYGILSLIGQGIEDLIHPDYTFSITKVFTDFAKAVVKSTGTLDFLTMSRPYHGKRLDLPTWVPDWTNTPLVIHEMTHVPYKACKGREMRSFFFLPTG